MSTRERLERKMDRRRQWAESRDRKAQQAFDRAHAIGERFAMGQPILVGHHSEGKARRDQARMWDAMDRAVESQDMADHHTTAAAGIADQLDRSIYSDDADALERLAERIAELEAKRERIKAINAHMRKVYKQHGTLPPGSLDCLGLTDAEKQALEDGARFSGGGPRGYPSYMLTNLSGNITRQRDRLEQLKRQQAIANEASATDSGVLIMGEEFVGVVFAEKPEYEVRQALKDAGFRFSGGRWVGYRAKLPQSVLDLA